MADEGTKTKVGQSLNEELGGKWETRVGGEVTANEKNAAPNASAKAKFSTNSVGAKAEAGAEANAFQFKQEKSGAEIKAFGAEVGANAEAGLGGIGAKINAKLRMVDAQAVGFGVKLGAGVSTGASLGLGGVSIKAAGCGFSIGKKTGISVFDNEFYIDFPKMFSFFTGNK